MGKLALVKPWWQAERTPCAVCGAPVLTPDAHRDFHAEADTLAERFVQQPQPPREKEASMTGTSRFPKATARQPPKGVSMRLRGRVIAASVAGLAALATLGAVGAAATDGLTPATLANAGWICFNDPGAPRIVCSDPGHGRPTPNDPDAPPSYDFKIFALDGTFTGTAHLVRADLYGGQPCPQTGNAYFFIAPIGYYSCEHFDGNPR